MESTIIGMGDIVHFDGEPVLVETGLIVDSKPMVLGSRLVRARVVTAPAAIFHREVEALFPLYDVPRLQGL